MPSWLFHNNGDGTFTDVSKSSGVAASLGKAWGVVATDINNDGLMDLFVANDTVANFLFVNRGNGKFDEIGEPSGVAYSAEGRTRSGMGVDSADYDQDGFMDLFVSNLDRELYSLYRNNHDQTFDDHAGQLGIGSATRLMSGWGLKFFDFDNDGNLDLFLANGNPDDLIEKVHAQVKYQEPMLLFRGTGKSFENISAQSGPVFSKPLSARGMAVGDFNNDGALDVLVAVNDGAPVLLKNNVGSQSHWLGIKLVGKKANPDAVGARITYQAQDLKRSRTKVGGGSYLSDHDPRIVLGIGKRTKLDWLEIKWPLPSGATQHFTDLPIDRYITIVEGQEKWK
jgi:enediyne biosynthesis protein E4